MESNNEICLLHQISDAHSLQEICDLACTLIGNPVFVSDLAHTILAYSKNVEINDPTWHDNIECAHLQRNSLRQNRAVGTVHIESDDKSIPVRVNDDFLPYERVIKTLVRDNRSVGVLVATAYLKPFPEDICELLDLIAAFVLPQMLKERFFETTDAYSVENYLISILNGRNYTEEEIDQRLSILHYRKRKYAYVLCIGANYALPQEETEPIYQLLQDFCAVSDSTVFAYNASLIMVLETDETIDNWSKACPALTDLLENNGFFAGVSREFTKMRFIFDAYAQAQTAMELNSALKREQRFCTYDELSSYLLFFSVEQNDLQKFCHHKILKLYEYDCEHDSELCSTLQVYLEQAKSLAKTSELLFIHRNTVYYRINKCMNLMNTELEDGNEIFAFILSLRIIEYRKKILPKIEHMNLPE